MAGKLYSSWVHGCAAISEDETVTALYQGFGATFNIPAPRREHYSDYYWIHVPIPTPVLVDGARVKVSRVMYLFNAADGTALHGIHLFDGPNKIYHNEKLYFQGDHSKAIEGDPLRYGPNSLGFVGGRSEILFGLGLTLRVSTGEKSGRFFISAAGADFLTE